ncbi:hypothetical protein BV25DRAFT_1445047 [Artomyces pyxidatus]|uniref:Uncharacterized protein n=1 Tax=Artomyces pyxidatus TaxID=48021 RepID=A0ACB8SN06_9AGAM|nr:hypothetical protein BV25DRAFT_1445047 [Artomyces pyxidatus]
MYRKLIKFRERSAFERIPCELWQEIFLLYNGDRSDVHADRDFAVLLLSQVCRSWWTATTSLPRLWPRAFIVTPQDSPARMQFLLDRIAPDALLRIIVDFGDARGCTRRNLIRIALVIRDVLIPHCSRWEHLEVRCPPAMAANLSPIFVLEQPLTAPTRVYIRAWDLDHPYQHTLCDISFLRTALSLRRIYFQYCAPQIASADSESSQALSTVVELFLTDAYIDSPLQLQNVLASFTSLERLHLHDCGFANFAEARLEDRFVLPKLDFIKIIPSSGGHYRPQYKYDGTLFMDRLERFVPRRQDIVGFVVQGRGEPLDTKIRADFVTRTQRSWD